MAEQQKPKPKPKPPRKMIQTEQSERFIETARALGVDETGETFERAFKKIVPPKPARRKTLANHAFSAAAGKPTSE